MSPVINRSGHVCVRLKLYRATGLLDSSTHLTSLATKYLLEVCAWATDQYILLLVNSTIPICCDNIWSWDGGASCRWLNGSGAYGDDGRGQWWQSLQTKNVQEGIMHEAQEKAAYTSVGVGTRSASRRTGDSRRAVAKFRASLISVKLERIKGLNFPYYLKLNKNKNLAPSIPFGFLAPTSL